MKIKIRYIILALMLAASSFMLGSTRGNIPNPPQTLPETDVVRAYESPTFDHMGGDAEIPQEVGQ